MLLAVVVLPDIVPAVGEEDLAARVRPGGVGGGADYADRLPPLRPVRPQPGLHRLTVQRSLQPLRDESSGTLGIPENFWLDFPIITRFRKMI